MDTIGMSRKSILRLIFPPSGCLYTAQVQVRIHLSLSHTFRSFIAFSLYTLLALRLNSNFVFCWTLVEATARGYQCRSGLWRYSLTYLLSESTLNVFFSHTLHTLRLVRSHILYTYRLWLGTTKHTFFCKPLSIPICCVKRTY